MARTETFTCPPPFGNAQFPACSREQLPTQFFDNLSTQYSGTPVPLETPRPLIAIMSCQKHAQRRAIERATWIPALSKDFDYRFFVGEPFRETAEDEVVLPVPDDYASLPLKTRGLCKWAYERGYSAVFKIDDDTFIAPDRLTVPSDDYTGHLRINPPHNNGVDYARGGTGYWLSRRALKTIVEAPLSLFEKPGEDRTTANILKLAGIDPKHDGRYEAAPHNFPMPQNDLITAHCPKPELMHEIMLKFRDTKQV